MKIAEVKKQARQALQGNWGIGVLLTFIMFTFNYIIPTVIEIIMSGGFIEWFYQEYPPIEASLIGILISFIVIPVSITVYWFYLSLVRKNKPQISDVFSIYKDGKTSLKLIGTSILQGILLFSWSLLLIIPGIIKAFSYSQTFFLLRDHPEYTPSQAITESRKRMVGYKWKLFLLCLSFLGWAILCLFSLGIGFLWFFPYASASLAAFYHEFIYSQETDISAKEIIL